MEDTDPMQILLSEQQYKHLLQQLEEAKRHSKVSIQRLLSGKVTLRSFSFFFYLLYTHKLTHSHI